MNDPGLRPWFAALAPPIAWSAHLLLVYGLDEVVCSTALRELAVPLVGIGFVVFTLLMGGLSAGGMVVGWRVWRRSGHDPRADPPRGRDAFLGLAGVLLGGLFLVTILLEASPALQFGPCE